MLSVNVMSLHYSIFFSPFLSTLLPRTVLLRQLFVSWDRLMVVCASVNAGE